MSCNNAPGETRTPNLLIRSQFSDYGSKDSTGRIEQATDTKPSVTDTRSHNNSHNTSPGRWA